MADVTMRLQAWRAGDTCAKNEVFELIAREIRTIAVSRLKLEGASSLSAGDLANEAMLRLMQLDAVAWQDRSHILAMASRVMRQLLVDQARRRQSGKRRHEKVTLSDGIGEVASVELTELNMALNELQEIDADRAEIVEMRFFGGMSLAEIAAVKHLSESTVKRRWHSARAWLYDRLRD